MPTPLCLYIAILLNLEEESLKINSDLVTLSFVIFYNFLDLFIDLLGPSTSCCVGVLYDNEIRWLASLAWQFLITFSIENDFLLSSQTKSWCSEWLMIFVVIRSAYTCSIEIMSAAPLDTSVKKSDSTKFLKYLEFKKVAIDSVYIADSTFKSIIIDKN